jgi:hypothetical protein
MIFKSRTADLEVIRQDTGAELSPFEADLLGRIRAGGDLVTDLDLRTHVAPYLPNLKKRLYEELVDYGYYLQSPETVRTLWVVLGIAVIAMLGFGVTMLSPTKSPIPAIVGGVISFIIVALFARGMPKRTAKGAKALSKIRGFEEFIK